MHERILFIDDEQPVLDALSRMLHAQRGIWQIVSVCDPRLAWRQLCEEQFDAVVSDIHMPGIDGLQLLGRIKASRQLRSIPVIMLTGLDSRALKRQALDLGAADLLNKPVDPEDLVARLRSVLRLKEYQAKLAAVNADLEQKVRDRTAELDQTRSDVIWRLSKAAEQRDDHSGNHVIRVACVSRIIAEQLTMKPDFIETIFAAAPLHDIGKIGIPDAILTKLGPLDDAEWETMKTHCQIGAQILQGDTLAAEIFHRWRGQTDGSHHKAARNPILRMASRIAFMHHEKWDGTGYPRQLAGCAIPLEARIVSVADVFDALTSDRPYKFAYPVDEALEIVADMAPSHFDPRVYAAFRQVLPTICSVREHIPDQPRATAIDDGGSHESHLICR